jgi:hypothetical protein
MVNEIITADNIQAISKIQEVAYTANDVLKGIQSKTKQTAAEIFRLTAYASRNINLLFGRFKQTANIQYILLAQQTLMQEMSIARNVIQIGQNLATPTPWNLAEAALLSGIVIQQQDLLNKNVAAQVAAIQNEQYINSVLDNMNSSS